MSRVPGRVAAVMAGIVLVGCSSAPAPVEDLSARPAGSYTLTSDGRYRVRQGDTLYSIAFNYGLDWKDVARWNGVYRPYTIFPGQELQLTPPPARRAGDPTITTRAASTTPRATTRPAEIPQPGRTAEETSRTIAERPAATTEPPATPSASGAAADAAAQTVPPPKEAPAPAPSGPLKNPERWLWPAEGRVISRFAADDPARKGINIAGTEGQPIIASADGDVVYSGNGLIGFGELIIIKHSDSMLTAYAHNRLRLVQEGERVAAGSRIAEMGQNHQDQTMLHFELRVDGKPVDPLRYLPDR